MKDPLENISHDFKKDMSECPHCRYNTCRHECEECLKSELSLLRAKVERYEKALKKIAYVDIDEENYGKMIDEKVSIAEQALSNGERSETVSDVSSGSEGEKA